MIMIFSVSERRVTLTPLGVPRKGGGPVSKGGISTLEETKSLQPIVYRWFVDDAFSLFWTKDHVEKFKNYLNKQHKNISGYSN